MINIILGENDVGKSTLIKSLYHTLGADTPQLNNSRWKLANAIYVLRFSIGGKDYTILRDGRFFGFFDGENNLLGQYKGVSGEQGIYAAINPLLNFEVELTDKEGVLRPLGPAFYFLPFYVDQDEGWGKTWSCFRGLQAIPKYRKSMIEYHLGIKSQEAYAAIKTIYALDQKVDALSAKRSSLQLARNSYSNKKSKLSVDIDPEAFRAEIEELVARFNEALVVQNDQLALIKAARNRKLQKEDEIRVLMETIKELEADYQYAESSKVEDKVDCPTCGTEFANSFAERFSLLDDIDYCVTLADQKRVELRQMNIDLDHQNKAYSQLVSEAGDYKKLLKQKREDVTFQELITSEGYKDIMVSLNEEIKALTQQIDDITDQIAGEKPKVKVKAETKRMITETYQSKMKSALSSLNVDVLAEEDYDSIEKVIGSNAIGSDLPRSLLAQYYSFLHVMKEHNLRTVCPFVIDSPLQQEQDPTNAKAIFNFILDNLIPDQQLILGTIEISDDLRREKLSKDCKIIILEDNLSLLNANEYQALEAEIAPLHRATLEV
jgi:predicted  nucleic acid-binding Zn-ribbon protein